ncbi:hypothetical protein QQ045_007305 [Rhodiola kirilowii]
MASSKFAIFLLNFVTLLILSIQVSSFRPGQMIVIEDTNAPEILEVVNFAMNEHERLSQQRLTLIKVVKGAYQVVSGIEYYIVLEAKGMATKDESHNYMAMAIVWVKLDRSKQLMAFKPLLENQL